MEHKKKILPYFPTPIVNNSFVEQYKAKQLEDEKKREEKTNERDNLRTNQSIVKKRKIRCNLAPSNEKIRQQKIKDGLISNSIIVENRKQPEDERKNTKLSRTIEIKKRRVITPDDNSHIVCTFTPHTRRLMTSVLNH